MTGLTILVGADIDDVDRHVLIERCSKWYTRCINTVVTCIAPLCQDNRVCVIDEKCRSEILSSMARSTIGSGSRVRGHC